MDSVPQPLQIRPYEEADSAATLSIFIAAITKTAAADYTPEQVQAWAAPEQRDPESWHLALKRRNSFVATIDGELVGFSDVAVDGYLDMLFVAPEHQRRGVARRLLAEAEVQARTNGSAELYADVSSTARPFFESHGFTVVGQQHPVTHGVRLVNFRMRKPLT